MTRRILNSVRLLAAFVALSAVAVSSVNGAPSATKKPTASPGTFDWENAIIHIEVTSKEYNYIQPWERSERKLYKSGVVVAGHQIITTAEGLSDQTLIRLKKKGEGLFSLGTVSWIDYQSNLAIITTEEKDFWNGLQPAALADPVPITGSVRVMRWDSDELESRQGDIQKMTVDNSALSFVSVPVLKVNSTIPSVGYGEAITSDNKLLGLASGGDGDNITAVPSSFIASILKARQANAYTGLGYFDFTWDPAENPLNLDYLKLPGPPRGVIVKEIGLKPGITSVIHPRDVLLQIDGFDIDAQGDYHDPQYKKMLLENLSSRDKWAGASCKMKIWRDGKEMDIIYQLPKADFSDTLVPSQSFDKSPEYVLAGGFVFVSLSEAYLRSWGPTWRQHAPFRLAYYDNGKVSPERPERVVLSQVLPDPINLGYESIRNAVVDEINGIKISRISDVQKALKSPKDGFQVFTFEKGEPVRQAILDASEVDDSNQKIMARFHIPSDHFLNGSETATTATPVAAPALAQ